MNCCRRWPLGKHVAHHFALALIERAEFLTLQQFNVAVENRQGRLKVVGGRCQSVRRLAETVAQVLPVRGPLRPAELARKPAPPPSAA